MIRRAVFVLLSPAVFLPFGLLAVWSGLRSVGWWLSTGVWKLPEELPPSRLDALGVRVWNRLSSWTEAS
jgi:hypothetical protein